MVEAVTYTISDLEYELAPLDEWAGQCHAASLKLVKSGVLPDTARVARGTAPGVFGQHSWVVPNGDIYAPQPLIIDPTIWHYLDEEPRVWMGYDLGHRPHGAGSIWEWGRPAEATGPVVEFDVDWSREAADFLRLLGPLDLEGWRMLAHAPVGGWPSGEIFGVMYDDPRTTSFVPIDVIGMATDRNPQGLYR